MMNDHPVRQSILSHARSQKRELASLLLSSAMTAEMDVEQVVRVLDPLLNVERAKLERMMDLARGIAGSRRELPRWS